MHPAAQKTVERVLGVEWSYHLLNFGTTLAVVARMSDGESRGVNVIVHARPPPLSGAKNVAEALKVSGKQVDAAKKFLIDELAKESTQ